MDIQNYTCALYRNVRHDYTTMKEIDTYYDNDPDYVRISEPVKVEFIPANEAQIQEKMIQNTLEELDRVNQAHEERVESINNKLFELRALTAPTDTGVAA